MTSNSQETSEGKKNADIFHMTYQIDAALVLFFTSPVSFLIVLRKLPYLQFISLQLLFIPLHIALCDIVIS